MDIDRTAPVITQDEIVIAAGLNTVWKLLTDIDAWPDWQHGVERASLDTPLGVGSFFHWSTAGLAITSTVADLMPHERIAWSGSIDGIMDVHVWRLMPVRDGGVRVQTEESLNGVPVRLDRESMRRTLDQCIRSWLESLKRRAESQP